MTIDEAIRHCEDVAEKQDKLCEISVTERAKEQNSKCAEEHRQLAEWLKDYKRLLEQEPCDKTQMIDKSNFSMEQYKADLQSAYDCGKASVVPCGDAVSRTIVQEEITKSIELRENPYQLWYRIQALPSVSPQQSKGRWIKTRLDDEPDKICDDCGTYCWKCSACGCDASGWGNYKYCPNCGARMEVDS